MGLVALAVLLGYRLLKWACDQFRIAPRGMAYAGGVVVAIVVGAETARTILRNDDYKDPLAMWADVVARRPDNYRAINNLGNEFFRRGDDASARECFRKAVNLNPMYYVTLNNLAGIELKQGNEQEAMQYIDRALAIRPDYPPAVRTRGLIHFKRGEFAQAERAVREALALRPGAVENLGLLADILIARHDFIEAERICQEILRVDPGNVPVRDQLGRVYVGLGRMSESIAAFRAAHQFAPREPQYAIHLAWQLAAVDDVSLRDPPEAVKLARLTAEATGPDAVVLDTLALGYAASGQFELAAETATNALQLARSNRPRRAAKIEARLAAYVRRTMPEQSLRSFDD
jgi:tetratricopeptide (TPR) repeat protein